MSRASGLAIGLLFAVVASGCQETDDGISIDATGTVGGLAWLDRNGNGVLGSGDEPVEGIRVQLLPPAGSKVLYSAETDAAGEFILPAVMVGDYRADVDTSTVGDTLRVLRVDSANPTVVANETSTVLVAITYPTATTESLRAAPLDWRYFVTGRVISRWNTFGDGTIHIRDETGAIRGLRVEVNNAALGDRVRLLGTTSLQSGRSVLKDVLVFLVETGVESPDPVPTTTAAAASANAGALDAELVRVVDAVIEDTLRNSFNERVLRVDDGSGPLDVVLDRNIPFFLNTPLEIGLVVDATGVLLPPATGSLDTWVLKPRQSPDIVVQ